MGQENNERVLVVDDDDAIRSMVERVLKREKYEVDSARDGFEAIQKLASRDYAMVVLDLMMPRVDGHGVLQYLETELAASAPPVIVMTANLQGAASAERARPTFRVLAKPFEIRDLVENVRAAVGGAAS